MDKLFALPLWGIAWFNCFNALVALAHGNIAMLAASAALTVFASVVAHEIEWRN